MPPGRGHRPRMHIDIEGADERRKAAAARLLAGSLDGLYIDEPLQYLLGGRNTYMRLDAKLNEQPSKDLRAWFHGFSNLYFSDYLAERTVVTDRYFPSNWAWNCTESNLPAFDALAQEIRRPEHTFLLVAQPADLSEAEQMLQKRFRDCLLRYHFPFTQIDCTGCTSEEIAGRMRVALAERGLFGPEDGTS